MYRRRGRREYDVRRMHVQFRSVWEQGLSRASQIINNLKSKGWNVDGDFYFHGQAEREAEALRRAGYAVQRQPVAKWGDEEIYILAYKEEPKAAKAEEASPPPQPQPPKPKAKKRKQRDPVEEFKKMFWKKKQPDASYVDDGVVINPTYTMAVVRKDANPTSHSRLAELVKEITQNPNDVETLDYSKLVKAEKIGKMTRKPVKHVSFNVHCFSIKKIKQGMRVLGTKKAKAYLRYGKPLVIQGRHGHVVLVAEAVGKEADEPDVVSIATVQALS